MISVLEPALETAPLRTVPVEPRCSQCRDVLPAERANAALCADCALDGMPHTD